MEESLILSKFDDLVKSGLVQYDNKQEIIEYIDGDLKFQLILTSALLKKPTIESSLLNVQENKGHFPDRRPGSDITTGGYEIGETSSTHFMIANKFCFGRPHLMILASDGYRKQYEPLCESDFEEVWKIITTMGNDYVAFFNCGKDGGCSRMHKHLQVMPMMEGSFASFLDCDDGKEPNIPFHWFYRRFKPEHTTPTNLVMAYIDLLDKATKVGQGLSEHADTTPPGAACPHNMILTKRWMVVIPRRRAAINKEAGINALGMLGLIGVATKSEIDNLVKLGLTEVLREMGVPK